MKQVNNHLAVLRLAIAKKAYDDSNPDIGMGPSLDHFVNQAAGELEIGEEDFDRSWVILQMRKECR